LPDSPVPFRPGADTNKPVDVKLPEKPIEPSSVKDNKPEGSLLKKVISSIESKKPWVPPEDKKPNPITDLNDEGQSKVDEVRRQRSDQQNKDKTNDWSNTDDDQ